MDNFTNGMEERLVSYLDGEMEPGERKEMEAQLAIDPALQAQLESLQATREAVRLFGLQQQVSRIHPSMMEELQPRIKPAQNTRRFLRYASAVAASLLLIVGAFFAYNFFTLSPDKVFSANYRPYEISTLRGSDSASPTVIEEAYSRKNYTEVVNTFYDRPFTTREILLRGMSYMELKADSSAVTAFQTVMAAGKADSSSLLQNDAAYYLALSYIRLKKYNEALALLQSIRADQGHLYHDRVSGKLIRQVKLLRKK